MDLKNCFFALLLLLAVWGVGATELTCSNPWEEVSNIVQSIDESKYDPMPPNQYGVYLLVGDAGGRKFFGKSSEQANLDDTTKIRIYSASKWVASNLFLKVMRETKSFQLDDKVNEYIPWWTKNEDDPRSRVTFRHTLNFQTGWDAHSEDADCIQSSDVTLEECVRSEIYPSTLRKWEPGTTYSYGVTHMLIGGVALQYATGREYMDLFKEYLIQHYSWSEDTTYFPSEQNPRIPGGLIIKGKEYEQLLADTLTKSYLPRRFYAALETDYILTNGAEVDYSPMPGFHYGLGNWIECGDSLLDPFEPSCARLNSGIYSSAGGLGFYPWIDRTNEYYAIMGVVSYSNFPSLTSIQYGFDLKPAIERALQMQRRCTSSAQKTEAKKICRRACKTCGPDEQECNKACKIIKKCPTANSFASTCKRHLKQSNREVFRVYRKCCKMNEMNCLLV